MPKDPVIGQLDIIGEQPNKLSPQEAEFLLNGGKTPKRIEKLPPGSPPKKVVDRIKKSIERARG